MKHLLSLFVILLTAIIPVSAQFFNPNPQLLDRGVCVGSAKYRVTYRLSFKYHPDLRDYNSDTRTVLIGRHYISDFSDIISHFDSLRTEDDRKGLDVYSSIVGSPYPLEIIRNIRDKKDDFKYRIHSKVLVYEKPAPQFRWEFTEETDTIAGYECTKAMTTFAGRNYEAWFASELPLPFGPYRFGGLPGLIMKIQDSDKQFTWEAESIEKFTGPIMSYEYDGEQKCTPTEADRTLKRAFKAPYSFITSDGLKLLVKGSDGKFHDSSEVEEPEIPLKPLEFEK